MLHAPPPRAKPTTRRPRAPSARSASAPRSRDSPARTVRRARILTSGQEGARVDLPTGESTRTISRVDRYLDRAVREDLARKMVFLGGARQVGKTMLAKTLLDGGPGYLTWDAAEDRERILARELPASDLSRGTS